MNYLQSFKTIALALILSIGVSYAYAAWAPPSTTPTGGNTEAPINVGPATQVKAGALTVNGLMTAVSNLMIGSCSQPGCPTGPLTINNTTGNPWVDIRSNGDANNYSAISLWSNAVGSDAWPVFSGANNNKRWAIGHRKIAGAFSETNNFFIEECSGQCLSSSGIFNQRLTIKPGGNVGIGTLTPTAKLHIGGTSGVDGIRFPDGTLQKTAAGSGGAADWNTMVNIPVDFSDNVDNVGAIKDSATVVRLCPSIEYAGCDYRRSCVGQLTTNSSCIGSSGWDGEGNCVWQTYSCDPIGKYLVQ